MLAVVNLQYALRQDHIMMQAQAQAQVRLQSMLLLLELQQQAAQILTGLCGASPTM